MQLVLQLVLQNELNSDAVILHSFSLMSNSSTRRTPRVSQRRLSTTTSAALSFLTAISPTQVTLLNVGELPYS